MNKLNPQKIIFIVFLIAFTLRTVNLTKNPPGLDWDEVSNTYNAYSIVMTGRDEYGNFLPLTNRSFDDYKPPLYMYLQVPFVLVFGLSPLAARLPSAIFGSVTVVLFYLLTKKLFEKSDNRELIALFASLLLATSPWHLQFSRVGFEANIGLFFTVAAVTSLLYARGLIWLLTSAVILGFSFYTYHSQRIFMPLIILATAYFWKKQILAFPKKHLISFILLTIVITLPLMFLTPKEALLKRLQQSSEQVQRENYETSIKLIDQDKNNNFRFPLIHHLRSIQAQSFVNSYLLNFDFNFLFAGGDDNFRHHIERMGMLYLFQLPLAVIGIYLMAMTNNKETKFILLWLLLAPVSAAFAFPSPHAIRSYLMIIPLQMISAYSLAFLFSKDFLAKKTIIFALSAWIVFSTVSYLHDYWVHYPQNKASFWQYGYKEAVLETEKLKNQFEKITVDNSIEQAYIFWLFYTKYNPNVYQEKGDRYHFDKYYFTPQRPTNPKELFISDAPNFPKGFTIVETISYPDGQPAVVIGHPQ